MLSAGVADFEPDFYWQYAHKQLNIKNINLKKQQNTKAFRVQFPPALPQRIAP